jgi:hypothetical protein
MTSFRFDPGPRLICGTGATASLAEQLPPGPCLFVTDQGVRVLGLADPLLAALQASGR